MKKKKPAIPKVRRAWTIDPTTRVKNSAKLYSRRKARKEVEDLL